MSTDRSAAIALVTGSLAGLVTMALHPTGHDVIRNASSGATNTMAIAVHALALLGQPLMLAGSVGVTLRLRARRDLAVGALVFYAFASVAVLVAAVASGFLAPAAVRGLAGADEGARGAMLSALRYTGLLNQSFAKVYVMFGSVAILLWSAAALRGRELSRTLALYGVLLGVLLVLGVTSGRLRLDAHGFGLVVLGQGVWMTWAAARLWQPAAER